MPVYKSIQLVGTSEVNWAEAVKEGLDSNPQLKLVMPKLKSLYVEFETFKFSKVMSRLKRTSIS